MLGMLLQDMIRGAAVRYENTQISEGYPGLRPDIIITDSGHSPVAAQSLNRRWIGIENSPAAIKVTQKRLASLHSDMFRPSAAYELLKAV